MAGHRRAGAGRRAVLLLLLFGIAAGLAHPKAAQGLPARIADDEFWSLIEALSEPSGFFQSDNLVSNERMFQRAVPALRGLPRGGAYLGVAPDQNFTYILATEPRIAFIVDIRRGNLLTHLMYKALFELSRDRAEFLSRLFARPRPPDLAANADAETLFAAYRRVATSEAFARETLTAISDRLTKGHQFRLSPDDLDSIAYVYGMFTRFGPDLTYASSAGVGRVNRNMPTFADLQTARDLSGTNHAYLGSDALFQTMKAFEEKNLLVPVVGDFAGRKALRSVGQYLADRGATVTVFYVSNVEQYLFQNGVWREFYANVATLPLDGTSTFLRSARSMNVLDPIQELLRDVNEGRIRTYSDVTRRGGEDRAPW